MQSLIKGIYFKYLIKSHPGNKFIYTIFGRLLKISTISRKAIIAYLF
jgi:hypothetical protein